MAKRQRFTTSASVRDPVTGRMGPPRTRPPTGTRNPSRKRRNAIVAVPRAKLAFPQGIRTKLRYTERDSIIPNNVAQIYPVSFIANGLYDPTVALGGHQPRGFDQYMAIYDNYTVVGSKINVNWMYDQYDAPSMAGTPSGTLVKSVTTSTADQFGCPPVMVGIHKGVATLAANDAADAMEQDRTMWRNMTAADGAVVTSSKLAISDFFGKGNLVGAEGYGGTAAADPDNKIYWTIWAARAPNQGNGVVQLTAFTTIEYDVIFTNPKNLAAS